MEIRTRTPAGGRPSGTYYVQNATMHVVLSARFFMFFLNKNSPQIDRRTVVEFGDEITSVNWFRRGNRSFSRYTILCCLRLPRGFDKLPPRFPESNFLPLFPATERPFSRARPSLCRHVRFSIFFFSLVEKNNSVLRRGLLFRDCYAFETLTLCVSAFTYSTATTRNGHYFISFLARIVLDGRFRHYGVDLARFDKRRMSYVSDTSKRNRQFYDSVATWLSFGGRVGNGTRPWLWFPSTVYTSDNNNRFVSCRRIALSIDRGLSFEKRHRSVSILFASAKRTIHEFRTTNTMW